MVILYFGADKPWSELQSADFKRRNTIYLRELSRHKDVNKVVSFQYTNRKKFLSNIFQNVRHSSEKISDFYFTELFAFGRLRIGFLNQLFNCLYLKILLCQFKKREVLGWIYWPNGFMDYTKLGLHLRFVFDADHNLIDDPNLNTNERKCLENLLRRVARQAELVMSASRSMLAWFEQAGAKRTYRLMNGIDLTRFSGSSSIEKCERPTAVYCGVLSHWIDFDLFEKIVSSNPEIIFVIIGKVFLGTTHTRLEMYSNVKFLGEKTPDELAELLPTYHTGLALYNAKKVIDGDSMKIYEYLAAGLPVISTNFHAALSDDFKGLIYHAEDSSQFNVLLKKMQVGDLRHYSEKVNTFLRQATWQSRVNQLMTFLNA